MFDWNGLGPAVDFVGLENFKTILTDKVFIKALWNVFLIIVFSLGLQLPLALALAVLVGRDLPGRGIFPHHFFHALRSFRSQCRDHVDVALTTPTRSAAFSTRSWFFSAREPVGWLSNTNIVLLSVFIALTWKYFGFHMLLYLAGLQNIPLELEEAARIDGANSFQNFFYITLPLLGSTIRTSVYMSVLGSIQQFILVWIMTKGGPVNASETLATYMYRFGFVRFELGYGSAVAIYMFVLCLIFSLIYQRLTRQPDYLTGL